MAIDEDTLTGRHLRKRTAVRRSLGDKPGEEVFAGRVARQAGVSESTADPVEGRIERALAGRAHDRTFNAGVCGCTTRSGR